MYKKRIGIAQKFLRHPEYDEYLTCLDMNWFKFISSIGSLPIPIPLIMEKNSEEEIIESLKLDGLILSGGNSLAEYEVNSNESKQLSKQRDQFELGLLRSAINLQLPVIGVCRGMQLINAFFNGNLIKVSGHVSTRHKVFRSLNQDIKINHDIVNSFHSFGIELNGLGSGLIDLAKDEDDNVEAFYHTEYKLLGIMWHPEREKSFNELDKTLFKNHFKS